MDLKRDDGLDDACFDEDELGLDPEDDEEDFEDEEDEEEEECRN